MANRSIAPFSRTNIATFIVVGLSLGGIYAISACGLVVTYTTTGIFNFAHGAIGCFCAFAYWELRVNRNVPTPVALVLVIFVIAPLIGVFLDKVLMQRLRMASLVVQLMVTVGLMLAFMGITLTIWKPTTGRALPHFFESSQGVEIGGVTATWHRIITFFLALFIALLLRAILKRTRTGVAMRAVVDNRALAGLNGVKPGIISGSSWALGCMTAAIAGILIAPETGMVVDNLTLIIVIAFAAAAIGQLKSLPGAFIGGLIVGLAKAFSAQFVTYGSNFTYAGEAIPAVILFIAVLFLPEARLATGTLRATRRYERLTTPRGGPPRRVRHRRPRHRLGQRLDPVVLGHQLRRAHRGLARPRCRVHDPRPDHALARTAHRLGGPGELRQLRDRRLRRRDVLPRRRSERRTLGRC